MLIIYCSLFLNLFRLLQLLEQAFSLNGVMILCSTTNSMICIYSDWYLNQSHVLRFSTSVMKYKLELQTNDIVIIKINWHKVLNAFFFDHHIIATYIIESNILQLFRSINIYFVFCNNNLSLYFFGRGFVLNDVWQQGHLDPDHLMNISQLWQRFCPLS